MDSSEGIAAMRKAAEEARQQTIDQAKANVDRARSAQEAACWAVDPASRAARAAAAIPV